MALIKCPECGNDISDKSITCIHCGYPISSNIKTTNKKTTRVRSGSKGKIVLVLIAIVVLLVGIVSIFANLKEQREQAAYQAQLEAEQQAYQALIEESKSNILPYLEYIGKRYEAGEKVSLPSDLYESIDNVEFMGLKGSIKYGTTAISKKDDYSVRYCSWTSIDGFSEEEFQAFVNTLNDYFGYEADADSRNYSTGHTHRYYWLDTYSGFFATYGHGLFMYHADGNIEILWANEFCDGADFFGF